MSELTLDRRPLLTQKELSYRLLMFNLTNNWSWFSDVPEIQQVSAMYPTLITAFCATRAEQVEQLLNCFGNEMTDEEQQDIRDRYA